MRAELQHKQRQAAQRSRRVRTKVRGTAERPRLSVNRSNRYYYVQIINDDAGATVAQASTAESAINNVNDLGAVIAKRAQAASVTKVVLDRGSLAYTGNLAQLAQAARDAGLEF